MKLALSIRRCCAQIPNALLLSVLLMATGFVIRNNGETPQFTTEHATQDEAQLPELIELEIDPINPEHVTLRIHQKIQGRARLEIDSPTPVRWLTAAPKGLMTFNRQGSPREYTLDISAAKKGKAADLKASLVFENEQGQPFMHVSKTLAVNGPAATPTRSLQQTLGQTRSGRDVSAWVPLDVPVPQTRGAAR